MASRLIVPIIIGCLGIVAGWLQFRVETRDAREIFQDPAERIASIREAVIEKERQKTAGGMGPKLQIVGGKSHNFGSMERGTSRIHKFVFRNIGDQPLRIDYVGSTCKCTLSNLEQNELQPGEETSVELKWTAENVLDQFAQSARFITSDPENPEVQVEVRGFITNALVFDPIRILFGDVSSKEEVTQKTTFYSSYRDPLEIRSVSWSDPRTANRVIATYTIREIEPGSEPRHRDARYAADFEVTLKPGLPTGAFAGSFNIETNFPQTVPTMLPIDARIFSAFRISGGTNFNENQSLLTLGKIKSEEGGSFNLLIAANNEDDVELELSVGEVKPECIQVKIDPPTKRGSQSFFRITLEIPPGTPPIAFPGTNPKNFGKVIFRSNLESAPEIPLYLRGDVEE